MALLARCTTAILLVAAHIDCAADSRPGPSKQPSNVAGWRTVWADEFDGSAIPDSTKWVYEVGGHGWGNNEERRGGSLILSAWGLFCTCVLFPRKRTHFARNKI